MTTNLLVSKMDIQINEVLKRINHIIKILL